MPANCRQYGAEFKAKVVLQVLSGEKNIERSVSLDLCRFFELPF